MSRRRQGWQAYQPLDGDALARDRYGVRTRRTPLDLTPRQAVRPSDIWRRGLVAVVELVACIALVWLAFWAAGFWIGTR